MILSEIGEGAEGESKWSKVFLIDGVGRSFHNNEFAAFIPCLFKDTKKNVLVWCCVLCGAVVVRQYMRQQKPKTPTPLSEAEQKELAALMAETNSESAGDKPS